MSTKITRRLGGARGLFGQRVVENRDQQLVKIARLAMRLGRKHLAQYAHVNAPKKFTQPQLFACLILKGYRGDTYRRVEENCF